MDIEEVTKFVGLPAQSKDFDRYLSAHGLAHRPVFKGTPVDRISVKAAGISLVFDTAIRYEKMHGPLREGGSMIFSTAQIYSDANNSGFEEYRGTLPYGLTFKLALTDTIGILGTPTVSHTFDEEHSYVWYNFRGNTIGITFLSDEQGISWLEITRAAKEPPVQVDWD
ncbi:hypothetical protein [Pseudoduganella lutea]|uniref:Uncharacterized protein n=1 Tax=Pseudoduganella lutea TaxID=321985 RepID=A0A4P6KUH5_9BURK|nr:hypothetical protein [Pseudoduganella lutea]QBE61738.1 hypothetical protein EWM63_00940 [Pseudoduganella lutea]